MAKLAQPYQCDVAPCRNVKGAANHWFLAFLLSGVFRLEAWSSGAADNQGALHICSEACAQKALAKWMAHPEQTIASILREITHV